MTSTLWLRLTSPSKNPELMTSNMSLRLLMISLSISQKNSLLINQKKSLAARNQTTAFIWVNKRPLKKVFTNLLTLSACTSQILGISSVSLKRDSMEKNARHTTLPYHALLHTSAIIESSVILKTIPMAGTWMHILDTLAVRLKKGIWLLLTMRIATYCWRKISMGFMGLMFTMSTVCPQ